MGQGLNTKVAQVVAHELGISLAHVRSTAADTSKVANTSATAASTGSDLNGKAGQDAARQIKARLAQLARNDLRRPRRGRRLRRGHVSASTGSRSRLRNSCGRPIAPASSSGPTGSTPRPSCTGTSHDERPAVLLLRLWRGGIGSHRRHADRRMQAAAGRPPARRGRFHQSGDRHRTGRGRLHPGHGLAHDRGAVVEQGRRADDACALDVQDSGGQRLPGGFPDEAVQEQQRRGHDPALEGDRRAAAAAAVLGVLRDSRRDRQRRRLSDQSAARRAGDGRIHPEGDRSRAIGRAEVVR